jgi:hypothetical protein
MLTWLGNLAIIAWVVQILYWIVKVIFKWLWPGKDNWVGILQNSPDPLIGKSATYWRTERYQQIKDTFLLRIEKDRNQYIFNIFHWLQKFQEIFLRNCPKCKRFCFLDLGRGRVIDQIKFMRGYYSAMAYPIKWAVLIHGQNAILPDWEWREQTDSNPGHNIIINLEHPAKVTLIAIQILEPRMNEHWAVGDIKIREVRLFGKFWKVEV